MWARLAMSYPRLVPGDVELEGNAPDPTNCCVEKNEERQESDVCLLLQQERQLKLLEERAWLKRGVAVHLEGPWHGHGISRLRNVSMVQMCAFVHLTLLLAAAGAHGFDVAVEEALSKHCPGQGKPLEDFTDSWLPRSWGHSQWFDNVSFVNGDWIDESDQGRSLLPFTSIDSSQSVEQLASFWATDVSSKEQQSNKLKVIGTLWLAMTTSRDISQLMNPVQENRYFQSYPGFSLLSIAMEGYYMETATERLLCMLGCTVTIPEFARLTIGDHTFQSSSGSLFTWSNKDKDCDYFLQLRYPRRNSLTTPAVRGHLSRLQESPEKPVEVELSSGWKSELPYSFDEEGLVAAACNQTSLEGAMLEKEVYKGHSFCTILSVLVEQWEGFSVRLNWPCPQSHSFCSQLGPFRDARPYKDITDAKILFKNLYCSNDTSDYSKSSGVNTLPGRATSKVSAVFRLQGKFEDWYFTYVKTGCNNGLTLNAEGLWDQDSGVLCMAACRGNRSELDLQSSEREDCDVRVCLYLPLALTIVQRGTVVGTISSTRAFDPNDARTVTQYFYPLSFFLPYNPQGHAPGWNEALHYEYTKIDLAYALLDRYQPTGSNQKRFFPKMTSSLSKYPSLESGNPDYNRLRSDLIIQSWGKSTSANSDLPVEFDFVSMDDVLFRGWAHSVKELENRSGSNVDYTKKLDLLKVAGNLKVGTVANVSTEGLYDPKTGRMYMVGCRDVREEWFTLSNVTDLNEGLDCFVEVVMQYPAVSLMWIASQSTVKISISSTRPEDDPIHFAPVKLFTAQIVYGSQREGIISEKNLEGALSLVTLSFMLLCLLGQGWHMERHPESVAFVSILMLGIQAVAFASPLITGAEEMFAADKNNSVAIFPEEAYRPILYIVRTLSLVGFLLLLRLVERVWSARVQASSVAEVSKVPSEKKVCILWAIFHIVGLIIVVFSHSKSQTFDLAAMEESAMSPVTEDAISQAANYSAFASPGSPDWQKEVLEYGGLIQDLFLLPQVFGGAMWKLTGKPLHWLYYVGITVLRLLPHVYDSYRKSHFFPYVTSADYLYANPSSDFFSHAGDIVIPVLSLVLAVAVCFQQSYSNVQWRGLFSRSTKYEAVPTESELANRIHRTLSTIPENRAILARGEDDPE